MQLCDKARRFTKYDSSDNVEVSKFIMKVFSAIHQPLHEDIESVATLQRQQGPSRTVTVVIDFTDDCMELSDIHDIDLRRKTEKLSTLFADKPVSVLYEAILKKNGSFGDACTYLAGSIPGELGGDSDRESVEEPKQEPKQELKEEPA